MTDVFLVVALGFVLGMRHATDADHVIAVTTIVARQRGRLPAAFTGLLWGAGHSLTILAVGSAIILFNLTIPYRVGLGMELSVGAMLVALGVMNMAAGCHVNAAPNRVPVSRRERIPLGNLRPMLIGVVHGLAGSAAVTLLIVATVRDPIWSVGYLLVFGFGTTAGMMLVSVSIASAVSMAGGHGDRVTRHIGVAAGLASIVFGLAFAYQVWSSAGRPAGAHGQSSSGYSGYAGYSGYSGYSGDERWAAHGL